MSAVTIQGNRGVALQGQLTYGRGGIQNGSFNKRVHMGNALGGGEIFIDNDGQSRLRFPPSTAMNVTGTVFTITHTNGVSAQTAQAVFDYTFTTNAAGVTTITANVAPVGFTVTKVNAPNNQGGTEDEIIITPSTVGATLRMQADLAILAQSQTAPGAVTRQVATAANIQNGRY